MVMHHEFFMYFLEEEDEGKCVAVTTQAVEKRLREMFNGDVPDYRVVRTIARPDPEDPGDREVVITIEYDAGDRLRPIIDKALEEQEIYLNDYENGDGGFRLGSVGFWE